MRAAVRQGRFSKATGYEINPALVGFSRLFATESESYRLQSLWEADLSECDVVCVYGVPSMMNALAAKLCDELPAGSHVCSNLFELPSGGRLTEVDKRFVEADRWSMDDSGFVRLYRVEPIAGVGCTLRQRDT